METLVPLKQTASGKVASSQEAEGQEVEEKEEKGEEGEVQKKELEEKVKGKDCKAERDTDAPERDKSWGNLEDGSFSWCCWDRIGFVSAAAEKGGDDGKVAAAASERGQMGGGNSTKVETAKSRQD